MTLDAYDEAHPCRLCRGTEIDSGWYSLGLQDGETVVFVVPGGGPVVNPVVGFDRSQWERLFWRCFICMFKIKSQCDRFDHVWVAGGSAGLSCIVCTAATNRSIFSLRTCHISGRRGQCVLVTGVTCVWRASGGIGQNDDSTE